ncbi:MAG TPA: YbaK/EbsC family protein [Patescibacteria group bacterium]|nr:YbaK/EbsC family protein [Patescibacteria group bacterium]
MAIPAKITKYLDQNKYKYQIVEHKTVFTAWDKAQTEKVKPIEVSKSLVIKMDNDYALALVPSNKKLDKIKLLKVMNTKRKKEKLKNYKKLDLAKEVWMKKNLPGRVGATPPFSGLLKLPVFIDATLTKNKKIYVGSGEYTNSFLVSTGQYLKTEKPVKGSFSMKK